MIADVRESAGMHSYDGVVQDLSNAGIRTGLAALAGPRSTVGAGSLRAVDPVESRDERQDEAHLAAFEAGLHWYFGDFQAHRRDPLLHLGGLDLACYDREYAPAAERAAARRAHVALWPAAIDV